MELATYWHCSQWIFVCPLTIVDSTSLLINPLFVYISGQSQRHSDSVISSSCLLLVILFSLSQTSPSPIPGSQRCCPRKTNNGSISTLHGSCVNIVCFYNLTKSCIEQRRSHDCPVTFPAIRLCAGHVTGHRPKWKWLSDHYSQLFQASILGGGSVINGAYPV